ncbi:STAS domain-containing protein [Streptomyces sp. NPDC057271]|uniref:STAS domain-containing protein n=1 Tax=unclassified Streptomyces TaxID=2593676 RepID=UPI00363B9F86
MALLPGSAPVATPHEGDDDRIGVSVTPTACGVGVRVRGEIDLDSVGRLRTTLLRAMAAYDGVDVTLDLSGVSFCDSSGLNALLLARRHALREGRRLTITAAGSQVTRLLEVTGSAALFRSAT